MNLNVNITEAKRALTEKPLLATSAERVLILDEIKSDFNGLPHPRRFAAMLATLLSRVSTPLESYDLIAGRCVDRLLTAEEEACFQAFLKHPDHPKKYSFLSSGHCAYDWETLLRLGLPGLRREAERSLASRTDGEERDFLTGIIEIYDAISAYLLRYAQAASEMGMDAVARNLEKVATAAPDDFYSALQLHWTVAFINCAYITANPTLTLGRMDQILYPYYAADIASGKLTREGAAALITDYYCKHNLIMGRGEHQVGDETNSTTFERICNFDAPQYLLLAGTNADGSSAVNDLTQLFAECIVPAFKNPVVVVRYFKGLDQQHPELWRVLTDRSLKSASLMYYNDTNVKATYARMGIPAEDIEGYIHFGCNWPGLGTCSTWGQGGPKSAKYDCYLSDEERADLQRPYMRHAHKGAWPMQLSVILRELADRPDLTMDDVYTAFFAEWASFLDRKLDYLAKERAVRRRRPARLLTFTDCFNNASVAGAACHSAGAKYLFEFQSFYMFGTTVDCMIVLDELVFRQKKVTVRQLLEAAEANFEGYEELLALCRSVPKYGSDTPLSNAHAARLSKGTSDLTIEKSIPYVQKYGVYLAPCMQSDTWHLKVGQKMGATVNGRLAGTPYSQNSRPANGSSTAGVTGMLNAMLNLPCDGVLSGALNLDVNPKDFAGEQGRAVFAALLATYFNHGGLHAQVTSANVESLIDAQKNPNEHRDLRVRVTVYSGIFVDICKDLQDDIIERLK